MKQNIFDFNIHPNFNLSNKKSIDNHILNEFNANPKELLKIFKSFQENIEDELKSNFIGYNFMIFSNCFEKDHSQLKRFVKSFRCLFDNYEKKISITLLVDPRVKDFISLLDSCKEESINFIKFHPYHQKIDNSLFKNCVEISKEAEKRGIGICIDASYGTKNIYKYDNLLLATLIFEVINKVPVIILHLGGLRAIEAALIIQDTKNGFIETSFSPFFYKECRTYDVLVDSLILLKSKRILYASDYPYISLKESIKVGEKLFSDANFSDVDKDYIFYKNAENLI